MNKIVESMRSYQGKYTNRDIQEYISALYPEVEWIVKQDSPNKFDIEPKFKTPQEETFYRLRCISYIKGYGGRSFLMLIV